MADGTGRLADRVILSTGSGSGISRAAALAFAASGAKLVLRDVDKEAVELVTNAINDMALAVQIDTCDEQQVADMPSTALEAFGRVYGLYTNAGIDGSGRAHELSRAEWTRTLDGNLTGTWLAIRAVLPACNGSIVTQASTAALAGVAGLAAYGTSKEALWRSRGRSRWTTEVQESERTRVSRHSMEVARSPNLCPAWWRCDVRLGTRHAEPGRTRVPAWTSAHA